MSTQYTLRDYQQAAVDAVIGHVKECLDPCVIEAATGAGKSMIIAEIAKILRKLSKGKNVLCLAPSAELVTQNREKYLLTGRPASVFSASAGGRCLKHSVVFGTPVTVLNGIDKFSDRFCAVIIDETDLITPTVKAIIEKLRSSNPNIRVIGLTATPYRMGSGYIYKVDESGRTINPDAYFYKKVYTVHAQYLIDNGYLSKPIIGAINSGHYETLDMQPNKMGMFKKEDVDRAYAGHGRKTGMIVADIVAQSVNRKSVMIFAATIQHAEEVLASLPPGLSAIITGKTAKKDRDRIIRLFKNNHIKYIVNVAVLTVGFDSPTVDVIALLRATESVRLLQQIIGRGLRVAPEKEDVLILDYAENIERHCPDGDLFNPEITGYASVGGDKMHVTCPLCDEENEVSPRKNDEGYGYSADGYFLDLEGEKVKTEWGYMPSHFGRRCVGLVLAAGHYDQCSYRWTFKECPHCEAPNDVAARYCKSCKGEIVNPNDKLKADFEAMKKSPHMVQCDIVTGWSVRRAVTKQGEDCIIADVSTTYRPNGFRVWFMPKSSYQSAKRSFDMAVKATKGFREDPKTITYRKKSNSNFYEILNYNQPEDVAP